MTSESKSLLSIQIPNFTSDDKDVFYHIHVRWGELQQWIVTKTYDEFTIFNDKIESRYGSENTPHFTGRFAAEMFPIKIFGSKSSEKNSEKRRPKLEEYFNEVLHKWQSWTPRDIMLMPHPDGLSGKVKMHSYVIEFLEFAQHAYAVDRGEQFEEALRKEREAAAVAAADTAEEQRQKRVEKGEMTETEAHQERLRQEGLLEAPNPSPKQAAAAAAVPKKAPKKKVVELDDDIIVETSVGDDGFEIVEMAIDKKDVRKKLRKFTANVGITCREYRVVPNSHIDYVFQISLCGTSWTEAKRYSEIEALHKKLKKAYSEQDMGSVPNFDEAFANVWDKMDEKVARTRQQFFTSYFTALTQKLDHWLSAGNALQSIQIRKRGLTSNQLLQFDDTDESSGALSPEMMVTVDVNAFLYEFFNFKTHEKDLDAAHAEREQKVKQLLLSPSIQRDLERDRITQGLKTKADNFARRQKELPGILRDEEVEDFAKILVRYDDDREAIQLIQNFINTGYYLDVPRASNLMALNLAKAKQSGGSNGSGDGLVRETSASTFRSLSAMQSAIGSADTPCSITSRGLARLVETIPFDDTRTQIIKLAARVLSDDVHIAEVLGTVLYEWDALENELRELLMVPDNPLERRPVTAK
jgi:hypothetical protein